MSDMANKISDMAGKVFAPEGMTRTIPYIPISHFTDEEFKKIRFTKEAIDEFYKHEENAIPKPGDWVFWFPEGQFVPSPVVALVTQKCDHQRVLSLTIFMVGSIGHLNAVKHLSADATPTDRQRNGGWAWNARQPQLM